MKIVGLKPIPPEQYTRAALHGVARNRAVIVCRERERGVVPAAMSLPGLSARVGRRTRAASPANSKSVAGTNDRRLALRGKLAAVGRLISILSNVTLPPRRGCAYATVVATSCSVTCAPGCAGERDDLERHRDLVRSCRRA